MVYKHKNQLEDIIKDMTPYSNKYLFASLVIFKTGMRKAIKCP